MTSPGAVERSRVGVRVLPDTSVFAPSLDRYLARVERTLRVELPVILDDSGIDAEFQRIRQRLEAEGTFKLPAELDEDGLVRQRERYRKETEAAPPVKLPAEVENPLDARFRAQLQTEIRKLTGQLALDIPATVDGELLRVELGAQIAEIEKTLRLQVPTDPGQAAVLRQKVRAQIAAVEASLPKLKVDAEPVTIPAEVENPIDSRFRARLQADLRRVASDLDVRIPATPDGDVLRARLGAQIAEIERSLKVEVPTEPAAAAEFRRRLAFQLAAVERSLPPVQPPVEPKLDDDEAVSLRARLELLRRRLSGSTILFTLGIDRDSIARITAQVAALGAAITAAGLGTLAGSAALGTFAALANEIAQAAGAIALLPAVGAAGAAAIGALVVGFQGVGEAITAADDPEKFAEALENLSPEAREAAIAVKELGGSFRDVRMSVQDSLFEGVAETVQELAERLLPSMQRGLTGVAHELNLGTREWAAFAASPQAVSDLDLMFANIVDTLHALVPAGADFAAALTDIGTVGSGFLPSLGQGLADAGSRFREFIAEARETGQLEAFIQRALDTLSQLGRIIANIGVGLGNVFAIGQARGGSFLSIIEQITSSFREFTESSRGQDAFGDFFDAAAKAAEALMPVLGSLFELFASSVLPLLAEIGTIMGPAVVTVLDAIGDTLAKAQPGILAFAQGFASFLEAMAPALPAIGELVSVLGSSLGSILEQLGPTFAEVAEVVAGALAEAFSEPALIEGIVAMGEAFGEVVKALAPALPQLAQLAGQILKALAQVLERLAPVLGELVTAFLDALLPILPDLIDAFLQLVDAITPIARDVGMALVKIFEALAPVLPPIVKLFAALLEILGPIISVIADVIGVIADLIGWLSDLAVSAIDGINDLLDIVFQVERTFGKTNDKVISFAETNEDAFGRVGTAAEGGRRALEKAANDGVGFWGSLASASEGSAARANEAANNFRKALEQQLIPAFWRTRDQGAAAFWGIANAAREASSASVNEARKLGERARQELAKITFVDHGRRLTKSLADGIASEAALAAVRAAARKAVEAAAAFLPSSPAKVGPFSGRGWTPYRGQALAEGLAAGMLARLDSVRAAAGQLAEAANSNLAVSLGGDGTAAGGGNTFNVYGTPGMSEESLAHKTSRVVAWETKKSGAVP